MAFRWKSPDGKTGSWVATEAAAMRDAVQKKSSSPGLRLTVDLQIAVLLFKSLAGKGWQIEQGQP
ncbi:hypothetical protein KZZ08_17255 [Roseovarius mucosus]|uniref:Uncharacterized protein n=1 Tax=Roseovarius mucosus TaxID=215743 RepID=A0A1V0RT43_9RHOB|nr:hypothetical protein [Roseovarius mucosus]ARE84957.1 hypothetical protein ROSMUCSMR3_03503 [Roseovarius mucosus]MBW4975381.1 hypothetical protein [Roseovarius mucosus]